MSKTTTKERPITAAAGAGAAAPVPPQLPLIPRKSPAKDMTARELLEKLHATGMPVRRDRENHADADEVWCNAHPDATGEHLYRRLVETRAKQGTITRACRMLWGPDATPDGIEKQAPADELIQLRQENERLHNQVRTLAADKLGLQHQNTFLREQIEDLTRKVSYLKIGRSAEDLAQVNLAPA